VFLFVGNNKFKYLCIYIYRERESWRASKGSCLRARRQCCERGHNVAKKGMFIMMTRFTDLDC
jgi:hypothetical protein